MFGKLFLLISSLFCAWTTHRPDSLILYISTPKCWFCPFMSYLVSRYVCTFNEQNRVASSIFARHQAVVNTSFCLPFLFVFPYKNQKKYWKKMIKLNKHMRMIHVRKKITKYWKYWTYDDCVFKIKLRVYLWFAL